jgi:peptidoglycan hydrolase-like protein with peptidoglycan-binding domain
MGILKQGSRGDEVRTVQDKLKKLGFTIESDGIFGGKTHAAIITLQTVFGYDTDGDVGPATQKLIDQQLGYGWNLESARGARGPAAAS